MYQVINKSGNPAGAEVTNPDAIFVTKQGAEDFKEYLIEECGIDDELSVIPYFNDISNDWDFVEKYYPNYSSCNDIAENDDLSYILASDWDDPDSEHYKTAKKQIIISNEAIYKKAIEGFINTLKGN